MTEEDKYPDKVFVPNHMTDFEKLLFAQSAIKEFKKRQSELEIELGKAISTIDELRFVINHDKELMDFRSLKAENRKIREENRRLQGINQQLRRQLNLPL